MRLLMIVTFIMLASCAKKEDGNNSELMLIEHSGCQAVFNDYRAMVGGPDIRIYLNEADCNTNDAIAVLQYHGDSFEVPGARFTFDERWAPTGKIYLFVERL